MKRTEMRLLPTLGVFLAFGLLLVPQLLAQNPTGTLIGRVTDTDGGVLPGVTVSATSPNLQGTRITQSAVNGDYKVAFLPPGLYQISYGMDGFQTVTREVKISAAQTTTSDVALPLGAVTDQI
ncbi:MAG: carboxypeptidase regulatory-like domain-containing protein, partial [bacterium]|nr:carboxypeptidase regulatory-like domain-containing protein [bacterium]